MISPENVIVPEREFTSNDSFYREKFACKANFCDALRKSAAYFRMTQTYFDNDQKILRAASDISASVARAGLGGEQYESWRFEAVSDDGDKVISIVFLEDLFNAGSGELSEVGRRLPAIVFTYYRGGAAIYRTLAEFDADEFVAETEKPGCSIGESFFTFREAEYGLGVYIELRLPLPGGEFVEADFEWLFVEADMLRAREDGASAYNLWNIVSPRSDVSGRFTVTRDDGEVVETTSFRGTGVYEHIRGYKHLFGGIEYWLMGTAHFADSTVVFSHLKHSETPDDDRLIMIRDGKIEELSAGYAQEAHGRTKFGMRYPREVNFSTDDISLTLKLSKIIVSNVFVVRFLSEATLVTPAGKQTVFAITEVLSPKMKYTKWLSWLITRRGWELN